MGKYKAYNAWIYQHWILRRLLWSLLVYDEPMTKVEEQAVIWGYGLEYYEVSKALVHIVLGRNYYYLSKPSQRNQCDKSGCDNIWCYRTAKKRKCESQELKYKQDENGQQGKPSLSWDPIEAHWDSGERTWQSGKGARCNINRKIGGCIRPRQMEAGIQRSADHGGRC